MDVYVCICLCILTNINVCMYVNPTLFSISETSKNSERVLVEILSNSSFTLFTFSWFCFKIYNKTEGVHNGISLGFVWKMYCTVASTRLFLCGEFPQYKNNFFYSRNLILFYEGTIFY